MDGKKTSTRTEQYMFVTVEAKGKSWNPLKVA